ncbi:hypothetical protein [Methanothermococcus sp. Ax23]
MEIDVEPSSIEEFKELKSDHSGMEIILLNTFLFFEIIVKIRPSGMEITQ